MEYSLGQRQRSLLAPGDGEPDRISALPDDLLLTILARLGCTSTAACTSVLSRCWSSLWTRLREVILHGVALQPLESVLNHVSPAVSLLEIHVPEDYSPDPAPVSSLLHAAVRLAPEELVLTLPARLVKIDLPRFHRATSITLTSRFLILRVPAAAAGEYCPMLETLSLSGGLIGNLDALLSRCPRLRVLRLVAPNIMIDDKDPMVVHSETLQELFMEAKTAWVDIITPVLKQLTVRLRARKEVSISVLARRVENVSWHCSYIMGSIGFGLWSLELRLQTAQGQGQEMQLPSLQIYACIVRVSSLLLDDVYLPALFFQNLLFFITHEADNLAVEIEKHMVARFSVLELYLTTIGHVYGALMFHLLEMNRVHREMQRLKVVLCRSTE